MKRNVLLTSLIAIGLTYNANAATDVTFGGDYTMSNGNPTNVADTLAGATYDYTTSSGTETGIAYNTDPDKTKFTYTNPDDTTGSLNDTVPTQDQYVGTTTASGEVVSTQNIAAGQTADRANYTYVNGAGETVVLGDEPQNMTDSMTLNAEYAAGKEINFTNGDADTEFDGSLYSFQLDNGNTFVLSADGTKLLDENGIEVSPSTGTDIETKFNAAQLAYNTDKTAFDAAKADTLAKWGDEQTKFNNAEGVFNADTALIADLDAKFASIGTAQELYDAALAKQEQAVQTQQTEEAVLKAATDVYNKPILETITNGANDAIDGALAENGAIRTELDKKVNMSDAEAIFAEKQQWVDNTLGLESANSNAVADALTGTIAGNETTFTGAINMIDNAVSQNTSDIATNATNIAANKTAIENEVARATAAEAELDGKIATNKAAIENEVARATAAEAELDGKIATNTTNIAANKTAIENEVANRISADDAVLANAKAYADAKGTMSLQAAKDYTDVRFNELDEELSAGVASAVAMSSVAVSNVGKGEVSVGGGYGYYNSQSAIAFGAAMGISDNWSVNAAAGLSDSNVTFRAGTNYKFKLF
ncbi:MAG: YadA-like family protein [Alphaproteobacteria bacterium]|nr:YadA-like family protein [Alphaproteobacteria bacterium]